jgi:hypothetical protein
MSKFVADQPSLDIDDRPSAERAGLLVAEGADWSAAA